MNPTPPRDSASPTDDESLRSVADIAQAAARVLSADLPEFAGLPGLVRDLRRISWATALVLDRFDDGQVSAAQTGELLAALDRAAAAHPLGDMARAGLWREVSDRMLEAPPAPDPDRAAAQLRRAGFEMCPVCVQPLTLPGVIALHDRQRREHELRVHLREKRRPA